MIYDGTRDKSLKKMCNEGLLDRVRENNLSEEDKMYVIEAIKDSMLDTVMILKETLVRNLTTVLCLKYGVDIPSILGDMGVNIALDMLEDYVIPDVLVDKDAYSLLDELDIDNILRCVEDRLDCRELIDEHREEFTVENLLNINYMKNISEDYFKKTGHYCYYPTEYGG